MNTILCGLPGTGKSTVAQILAKHLNCPVYETDKALEARYEEDSGEKATCREIQIKFGEGYYRQLEQRVLLDFSGEKWVIDTGGGI